MSRQRFNPDYPVFTGQVDDRSRIGLRCISHSVNKNHKNVYDGEEAYYKFANYIDSTFAHLVKNNTPIKNGRASTQTPSQRTNMR